MLLSSAVRAHAAHISYLLLPLLLLLLLSYLVLLCTLLQEVKMAADCVGPRVNSMVSSLADGEAMLLENVRFYMEETANDAAFAKVNKASTGIVML
jgi:3-phosphoglycerate kinase